ncbi:MAG: LAGLIDADG family homing endonuclease [Candidatus Izemoplasmatales bacterium]|jgi:hypothetical protein
MHTELEKAYLAGLIDGEGSICILTDHKRTFYLHLNITNTGLSMLLKIKDIWGGLLYKKSRKNLLWKQAYELRWMGSKAKDILKEISPYLINKKPQAEISLRFETTRRGSGFLVTQEQRNIQLCLREQLMALNKRGSQ